ncbi:MAG: nickel-dependent hydrogenase large subunit [Candidatus Bathyarchaeia archaeon]
MVEIVIDPVTRIEGHLSVRVEVEGGVVKDSWVHGTMFRGFENILVNRDPRDAIFITPRICGVCYIDHGMASALCLESAFNVRPPPLATVMRNIIHLSNWMYDHVLHFWILAGPDYGPPYGSFREMEAFKGEGYVKALEIARICREASSVFAGKTPHQSTLVPGGVAETPEPKRITEFTYRVLRAKEWIESYMIPFVERFYGEYGGASDAGERPANLMAYGAFDDPSLDPTKRAHKPGVIIDGSLVATDLYGAIEPNIWEEVTHSWYSEDSAGKPDEAEPPTPRYTGLDKDGKYSWAKSPRWGEKVVEVGPLARMWSTALQSGGRVETDAGTWKPPKKPNAIERIYARAYEAAFCATLVIKELYSLLTLIEEGEDKVWEPYRMPKAAGGKGLTEAARGALGHWMRVEGGRIRRYQVITPTAWNASPRDGKGMKGPLEEALEGSRIRSEDPSLEVVRIVRSFDPCLACTVHVYDPRGTRCRKIP